MQSINPFFSETFLNFVSGYPKTLNMEFSCKDFNNISNRKGSQHLQDIVFNAHKVLDQRTVHPEFKDHPFKYLMYVNSISSFLEEFLSSSAVGKICAFEKIMDWILNELKWQFDPKSEAYFCNAFPNWFGYNAKEKREEFQQLLDAYNKIII